MGACGCGNGSSNSGKMQGIIEPWIKLLSEAVFGEVKCTDEMNACLVNHLLPPSSFLVFKYKTEVSTEKQDRQCTYNVTWKRVRVTTVAEEKQ